MTRSVRHDLSVSRELGPLGIQPVDKTKKGPLALLSG